MTLTDKCPACDIQFVYHDDVQKVCAKLLSAEMRMKKMDKMIDDLEFLFDEKSRELDIMRLHYQKGDK